ncbi:MAG: hypothetical protein AB1414_07100 [bacterium]
MAQLESINALLASYGDQIEEMKGNSTVVMTLKERFEKKRNKLRESLEKVLSDAGLNLE